MTQAMVAMEVQLGAQLQERDSRILQIQAECDEHIQNCAILQEQLNQESVAQGQTQQMMRQLEVCIMLEYFDDSAPKQSKFIDGSRTLNRVFFQ